MTRYLCIVMMGIFVSMFQTLHADACLGKSVFVFGVATDTQNDSLLKAVTPYKRIEHNGMRYYCGHYQNHPVLVVNTGIGKVYAAAAIASVIARYQPSFILYLGVAGKIDPSLEYETILVANQVYQVEHLDVDSRKSNLVNPNSGQRYKALLSIHPKTLAFARKLTLPKTLSVTYGRTATTDTYPENRDLIKRIIASQSKAVDMEDFAVIATCQLLQTQCLTVRAISDDALKLLSMQNPSRYQIKPSIRSIAHRKLVEYGMIFLEAWLKAHASLDN